MLSCPLPQITVIKGSLSGLNAKKKEKMKLSLKLELINMTKKIMIIVFAILGSSTLLYLLLRAKVQPP